MSMAADVGTAGISRAVPNLTESITERLLSEITGGDFALGDILPPEQHIADRMGVSRTVLREAMKAPSFIEVVRQQGAVPEPSTPEELAALGRRERQAWGAVVQATGAMVN